MTFTAVSLMTTTATLHQSFKLPTASSAIFLFSTLIPFSTLIIESSHMHKQKPCLFFCYFLESTSIFTRFLGPMPTSLFTV